jgi:hypothetical protein
VLQPPAQAAAVSEIVVIPVKLQPEPEATFCLISESIRGLAFHRDIENQAIVLLTISRRKEFQEIKDPLPWLPKGRRNET